MALRKKGFRLSNKGCHDTNLCLTEQGAVLRKADDRSIIGKDDVGTKGEKMSTTILE